MPPFKRIIICLVSIGLVAMACLASIVSADGPTPQADDYSGLKFVLQTQGGLAAYAQITSTFTLAQMRQAFTTIDIENSAYILGDYTLAGRPDKVKLAVATDGWALASTPRSRGVEYLYDYHTDYTTSETEKAIDQIAAMVNVASTTKGYYDFRNPQATNAITHWLYQTGNKDINSTITLPIDDIYLDRGYAFFTAASNSKFWINGQMVDEQGAIYQIVYRWGKLSSSQLRAGQANLLRQYSLTLFGTGFVAGVGTVYSGTTPITTSGGDHRDFVLAYPAMLGAPVDIQNVYVPMVRR